MQAIKIGDPSDGSPDFYGLHSSDKLVIVAAASEDAENEEEEVDEVKIEVHSSHRGKLIGEFGFEAASSHAFDLLGVPGSETREDEHPCDRDDPFHRAVGRKMLTTLAIISPIKAIIRNVPIFERSDFVKYP